MVAAFDPNNPAGSGMTLTFADDFTDPSTISTQGPPTSRWCNHGINPGVPYGIGTLSPGALSVANSVLTITAARQADGSWVTGMISSVNAAATGFAQKGGYFEARMQLPVGQGAWPAWWLLGQTHFTPPGTGPGSEIDIMEFPGTGTVFAATVHDGQGGNHPIFPTVATPPAWHRYGLYWDPSPAVATVSFYVDGVLVGTAQKFANNTDVSPMFLLLTFGLGDFGHGGPNASTPSPMHMLVDSVQVWQFGGGFQAIPDWTYKGNPVFQPTTPPPPATARAFLVGFYKGQGATDPAIHSWLGYYPDLTINGSYQVHQPGGGFFPPAGSYPIVFDLDVYANGTKMPYAEVAAGKWDQQITATLRSIPAAYLPSVYAMRLDSEFNLQAGYTAPGMTPAIYVAALDHVIGLCKAALPARVKYVWNPNVNNGGDLSLYVPTQCDVIGLDSYLNQWQTTAQIFGTVPGGLTWWGGVAKRLGKALALPEWGDTGKSGDGVAPTFINAVGAWAADAANNVVLLSYWDSTDGGTIALTAAQQAAFAGQFGGTSFGSPLFAPALPIDTAAAARLGF